LNNIVYNYKVVVKRIPNARTITGLIDLGFRIYQLRSFGLAGLRLPDPSRSDDPDDTKDRLSACLQALHLLLIHPDGQGRHVIVSPHEPSLNGRLSASVYIPCKRLCEAYPAVTTRKATFTLLNVVQLLRVIEVERFSPSLCADIIEPLELYDFPL
jgi:hypothetical protein